MPRNCSTTARGKPGLADVHINANMILEPQTLGLDTKFSHLILMVMIGVLLSCHNLWSSPIPEIAKPHCI